MSEMLAESGAIDETRREKKVTDSIVLPDLIKPAPDLVPHEVVRSEGVDLHVAAHRNDLRSRQVIEGDVRLEELRDLDDILGRGRLSRGSNLTVRKGQRRIKMEGKGSGSQRKVDKTRRNEQRETQERQRKEDADLPEELLKLVTLDDIVRPESTFGDGLLEELGRVDSDSEELSLLLLLRFQARIRQPRVSESSREYDFHWEGLTAANLSSKVEGSMLGKNLRKTGRRSSSPGMRTKTEKGRRRRRSTVVRLS